jgi:glycosyltransferase involved in cell wall biosynthesis
VANALRRPFFETPAITSQRPPVLLNIGVLEPRKQQLQLLRMAGNLWRRGVKFELHFFGNLEKRTEYGVAFSRELAMASQAGYARHLGNLPPNRLIAAMDAAAALVHTPTEESFGLVVAEALARNLKFFGAAVGGVVDIASDVPGAELFAPQDWGTLEEAIARWIQAGLPRPTQAAPVMRERYHPLVIARRHQEIYQEVVSAKRKTCPVD